MGVFKPNLWKLLLGFLLFFTASIVIMILGFLHSCPVPTSDFISLSPSPTPMPEPSLSGAISKITQSTVSILTTSCKVDARYGKVANIFSYIIVGILSYVLSCIILFFPHRKW